MEFLWAAIGGAVVCLIWGLWKIQHDLKMERLIEEAISDMRRRKRIAELEGLEDE